MELMQQKNEALTSYNSQVRLHWSSDGIFPLVLSMAKQSAPASIRFLYPLAITLHL